jgi:hypothetical protein
MTLEAWAEEFLSLDTVTGEEVLERLKERLDAPPSVRELQSSIKTVINANERARTHARALAWESGASSPEKRPTFADWAKTDPDGARKLVAVLDQKSYVRAELEAVLAKGTEMFDTLATEPETVDDRYTWSRDDPPCDRCGSLVANGPNSQARYDKITDTWTNAHIDCPSTP